LAEASHQVHNLQHNTPQPFVSDKLLTTLVVTLALTMATLIVTPVTRSDSGGTHNVPGDA